MIQRSWKSTIKVLDVMLGGGLASLLGGGSICSGKNRGPILSVGM